MGQEVIKVLVADDRPVVRGGLRHMLHTVPDIQVVAEACDGREAVQAVSGHRPDVVLMDIRMPNMDGLEATRLIKRQFPHTAVVVLTPCDGDAISLEPVRESASGYLPKNASRELVVDTIRAANNGGTLSRLACAKAVRGVPHPCGAAVR